MSIFWNDFRYRVTRIITTNCKLQAITYYYYSYYWSYYKNIVQTINLLSIRYSEI